MPDSLQIDTKKDRTEEKKTARGNGNSRHFSSSKKSECYPGLFILYKCPPNALFQRPFHSFVILSPSCRQYAYARISYNHSIPGTHFFICRPKKSVNRVNMLCDENSLSFAMKVMIICGLSLKTMAAGKRHS